MTHEELPKAVEISSEPSTVDSPDIEDDAADEDDDDDDAGMGRSQKYVDGLINRPLLPEQTELLKYIYKRIGKTLLDIAKCLWEKRQDDMQAFIEVSTVQHPRNCLTLDYLFMVTSSRNGEYE